MARMGGKRHLKALAAPSFWPILRKEYVWTVKPSPGPHPANECIPLLIIVRDILKYAKTSREARKIIAEGHIKIDGRVRRDHKFPVGVMDVIEISTTGEYYRVIPVPTKYLMLHPISKEEATFKLCKIINKTTVKGGHIQLNLHDGKNLLIRISDPTNPVEDVYKTMGTVKISIPDYQLLGYIPLETGALAIVTGGKTVGRVGYIQSVSEGMRHHRKLVTLKDSKGNVFQTTLDKVFIIGKEKPLISLPEGAL
ncbi:MAG: 30S ribosomal protein S4e [Thermoprotei archaeon]|nr:MAG: 30S ribosomal protein S4e [Thermoprotei archaeon]